MTLNTHYEPMPGGCEGHLLGRHQRSVAKGICQGQGIPSKLRRNLNPCCCVLALLGVIANAIAIMTQKLSKTDFVVQDFPTLRGLHLNDMGGSWNGGTQKWRVFYRKSR